MMNQLIVVGRLVNEANTEVTESGKEVCTFTLAVQRCFKNIDGEYETDFIDFTVFGPIAQTIKEYCKKGDIIGVKGRIQTYKKEDKKITQLIAEKVTFLSSKKTEE